MHLFLRTLGLSLFLGLSPAYSAFAFEVDGLSYEIASTNSFSARVIPSESGSLYNGDITIPESITYDGIKYTVQSIGTNAFRDCSGLTSIFIPNTVTFIGDNSFMDCKGLTEIVLPSSVQTINGDAFLNCENLKSVTLSERLTFIGASAFAGCKNLERVICPRQTPPNQIGFNNRAFDIENYNNTILYVPLNSKSNYENYTPLYGMNMYPPYWTFNNIVEFGDVVDGVAYFQDFNVTSKIRYTRSFKNTNWQPLYVPFAIPVDTLTNHGLKLAFLNPTSGDEEATVEFVIAVSGLSKPNTPYMIKAEEPCDVVLNFPSVATEATIDNSINCTSSTQKFTFAGTSNGVTGEDMYNNSFYAMAGGMLCLPQDNTVFLKPQRWYMKVENIDGTPAQQAATIRFVVSEEEVEDAPTAIESIDAPAATDDAYYNIEGRCTAAPAQSGLFIHQGKILLIRK
jgi:hypothetical protein